jgi:HK97 family phage portal protein
LQNAEKLTRQGYVRVPWLTVSLFNRRAPVEDRSLRQPSAFPVYPAYPVLDTGDIGPTAALQISDVFACVRALSDSAASLPLIAYRQLPDGSRERFSGRITDLIDRPSPAATTSNLIGTVMAHLNLYGNAYVGKFRGPDGTVAQLVPLNPSAVTVFVEGGTPLYTYMSPDGVQRLTTDDVLHIRGLSVDGILGISPIGQARQALSLAQNLAGHADSFAKNAGRPGGVLRVSGLRSTQPEGIKMDWEAKFVNEANSGKLLLLTGEGDIDYTQFSLSMADAQFVSQRQLSTEEIARIFRVPPWIIGAPIAERGITYATTEGQADAFVKFSLATWLTTIERALTADSDLSPSTVSVEFLLDGLLRADTATRAAVYTAALNPQTGWMTREEVRRLENLPVELDESDDRQPAPAQPPPPSPAQVAALPNAPGGPNAI